MSQERCDCLRLSRTAGTDLQAPVPSHMSLSLIQVAVDATAGTLSDPRQRFLGSKPVKLFRIQVQDKRGVSRTCRNAEVEAVNLGYKGIR